VTTGSLPSLLLSYLGQTRRASAECRRRSRLKRNYIPIAALEAKEGELSGSSRMGRQCTNRRKDLGTNTESQLTQCACLFDPIAALIMATRE
jgi:hypothetical protein